MRSLVIQDLEPDRYEIIVVDNNSSDETANIVREIQSQSPVSVRYHFESRPGVHYARNWEAVHAAGDILYYTDDMSADRVMLREMLRLFELDAADALL